MTSHEPRPRAAYAVFVLVACGVAACGRVPGQFEIVQNQQPQSGCLIDTSETQYSGDGTLDLSLVQAGAGYAYLAFPLVKNNLPSSGGTGPDGNQIEVHSFAIDITPSKFGSLPPNVSMLFNTLNQAPHDSADYSLLHYSVPWAASLSSGGGKAATLVGAFPVSLAARVAATGDVGASRTSMLVNAHIRAFGSTSTQDMESDPLDFPIYVCAGCLVGELLTCPYTTEPKRTGNPCNVSQDNTVDCCSLNGQLICPPIVSAQ
jgi:hypothetical protein